MFSFSGFSQALEKWGFVGAGVGAIVVAFLWGNYLLGFKGGACYLFIVTVVQIKVFFPQLDIARWSFFEPWR